MAGSFAFLCRQLFKLIMVLILVPRVLYVSHCNKVFYDSALLSVNPKGDGISDAYMNDMRKISDYSELLVTELIEQVKLGDIKARKRLAEVHLRLVISIAGGFRNRGISFEDLVSVGNEGLVAAMKRFDPFRGVRFSTYATYAIRNQIARALAKETVERGMPLVLQQSRREIQLVIRELTAIHGTAPTNHQIAVRLHMSLEELEQQLFKISEGTVVLNESEMLPGIHGDEDDSWLENNLISEELSQYDDYEEVMYKRIKEAIHTVLNQREREVWLVRHPLDESNPTETKEIARLFGVSRQMIEKIYHAARKKIGLFIID